MMLLVLNNQALISLLCSLHSSCFLHVCPKIIELQVGKGNLTVVFTGELNDKMKGFYRSKYSGPDGDDRYAAVTQFEVMASSHYNTVKILQRKAIFLSNNV